MMRRSRSTNGLRVGRAPRRVLLLALMAVAPVVHSQGPAPAGGAERSAWYMYFGDHPVSPAWAFHLEGQYRREDLGQRWEQLLVRPGIDYDLSHGLSAMVAYTYLRSYPYERGSLGNTTTTGPQPEHRILEEFKVQHKLFGEGEKAIKLSHRFRAEQRFEGTSTEHFGVTDWEFAERARYRLTADIPLRLSTGGLRPDYVSVYDEVFVNFGPHGGSHALNQNRTYGALGWNIGKNFQMEAGYLHQYMPRANGIVGEHNHSLQITINSTAPFRRNVHKK